MNVMTLVRSSMPSSGEDFSNIIFAYYTVKHGYAPVSMITYMYLYLW